MKIIINSKESYELDLQDEISLEQFQYLINRLVELNKVFNKFSINAATTEETENIKKLKSLRQSKGKFLPRYDRNEAIKYIKAYYKNDKTDFNQYLQNIGCTHLADSSHSSIINKLKRGFNILSEEVGLIKFPKRGESKFIDNLRIKEVSNEKNN